MTEQEYYSELNNHIGKEMVANMFQTHIRASFSEPLASCYCKLVDDARTFANISEYYVRHSNKTDNQDSTKLLFITNELYQKHIEIDRRYSEQLKRSSTIDKEMSYTTRNTEKDE